MVIKISVAEGIRYFVARDESVAFPASAYGRYVFAQVLSFIDPNDFKKCVDRYSGNHKVKDFSCWHQLLCMMFGQLAKVDESLQMRCE